jgi:hypothetical protein
MHEQVEHPVITELKWLKEAESGQVFEIPSLNFDVPLQLEMDVTDIDFFSGR